MEERVSRSRAIPFMRSLTISFTSVVTTRCRRADMDTKKSKRFHLAKNVDRSIVVLIDQNRLYQPLR